MGAKELLEDWLKRARENQHVHYECANFFSRLNYLLGVPAFSLSGIVGTAIFASIGKEAAGGAKVAIGLVSMVAALLSGLHTFLAFAERAEKHRLSGAGYAAIRRRMELAREGGPEDMRPLLEELRNEIDALAQASPEVPGGLRRRVLAGLRKEGSYIPAIREES